MATFEVQTVSDAAQVTVVGDTLGDLRQALKLQFGILSFEQKIVYNADAEDLIVLEGDDSVLMKEKPGLLEARVLNVSRQVDPRFKMEKETAFLEALDARRFHEAKEILESSGVTVDPSCIHKGRKNGTVHVTECPCSYAHPALTVAMMAGLESAVYWRGNEPAKVRAFMSDEDELCEVVALMIEKGADVNAVGDETQDCESAGAPEVNGKTPLCAAVQRGSPRLVRMLLDAKADPNHTHTYGSGAYGADRNNPFGPGVLKPESWLSDISNGSVGRRGETDPRNQFTEEILQLLRSA